MSGRGRGVSNAPAWMSRGGGGGGDVPRRRSPSPDRDQYGRMRGPPPRDGSRGPPPRGNFGRGPPPPYRGRGPPPRGPPPRRGRNNNKSGVYFNSYEEERAWVEERRRKRLARKTKFDVPPTPEQLAIDATAAAMTNFAATDFSGISFSSGSATQPQQTRHARRLYIGHLPPDVTEEQLHDFFGQAIQSAMVQPLQDDPILSVYINHERRFCFLEFKTVEMTTACLALDGINVMGRGKVKVKRPNDYNPAMAPTIHPSALPQLDVARLGIVSGTVPDGPNKVFIGGLHYHLSEDQVLELLQAFGQVKAFHLVKDDPDSLNSKGYCFVEYKDHNVTPVAVMGLNGMDLGGGKTLTARVAAARHALAAPVAAATTPMVVAGSPAAAGRNIVSGYDVEKLVDAAMGLCPMPAPPMVDAMGNPVMMATTSPSLMSPAAAPMMAAPAPAPPPAMQQAPHNPLDIANATLQAAFGSNSAPAQQQQQQPTRILVLLNMVTDQDLATNEDHQSLLEEVKEECSKYGRLLSIKIPRPQDGYEPTAVKKVFLEYATPNDASSAEQELAGRTFGPNVVQASYFSEEEYQAGRLR